MGIRNRRINEYADGYYVTTMGRRRGRDKVEMDDFITKLLAIFIAIGMLAIPLNKKFGITLLTIFIPLMILYIWGVCRR